MEKIIVNPERVRCYGNIMMEHSVDDYALVGSTILVDSDTVMGAETTVYSIEAESSTISVALVSSVASCSIGDTVTFTATVLDDEEPVEGGTVTFKLNTTTLGSDETDSSGVATYTVTASASGSNNFTAVYESHSSNTVSVVVSKLTTSTALSLGSASIIVGSSTSASATVTSGGSGVSGLTVTFYDGSTSLGTGTTNGSGVATYTLSGLAVGSHSITATVTATDTYDTSTSSASTLTVLDHSYSIAFDSSSYSTSDGNVTAYVTLLDNSSPVSGASISLTGTGSTLSATTNSSGVATFNLTGISSDCTLTATYDNVSDTATVTVSTGPLFEDDCTSSSGLTNYGTPLMMKGSGGSVELTYDSGNNCYKVNPTSNRAGETMCIPITPMNSKDNYKLTFKIKHGSTVAQNQPSVFVYDNTLSAPTFYGIRYMGNGTMTCHTFNQSTDNGTNSVSYSTGISSKWFTITLQREGTSLTLKVDDENGVNRYNKTHTASGNINAVGFGVYVYDRTRYYYIKDIVAEAL